MKLKLKPVTVKAKITLWFSALIAFICITMFVLLFVISSSVLHRDVKDELVQIVKANSQEIEYFTNEQYSEQEFGDQYVIYKDGYLEIDDDFLNESQGVYTALYDADGNLLYGQIVSGAPFIYNEKVGSFKSQNEKYYVYCLELQGDGLEGLMLQGVVNENANKTALTRISNLYLLVLPFLALITIVGGYLLAKKSLQPVNEISRLAEKITDGDDLSQRIQLKEGQDELHSLADTFNKMFARLEKSFNDEKQFTSDISHELRTPVTTALAQTELALEDDCTNEEYRHALEVIQRQCLRMKSVIEEMLSFSRLEKSESLPQKEKVDFSDLVKSICSEHNLKNNRNITLKCSAEDNIFISGSYNLLVSLVENLITNAYRYGKENGHIDVTLKTENEKCALIVADDGEGIAPEIQDKIFNRFFRGDPSRTAGDAKYGLGLGLPMARRIAELHEGRLVLKKSDENGSTFAFYFKSENI